MKLKKYKISFSGNKFGRLEEIAEILTANGYKKIYEPFGGSCGISINLKANKIIEECIANDFDGFIEKLPERIEIRARMMEKIKPLNLEPSDKKLKGKDLENLQELVKGLSEEERRAVCKTFVFSARTTDPRLLKITDFTYFRNAPNLEKEREYAEKAKAIKTLQLDYKEFLEKIKNELNEEACLIIDPPYLNSMQKQYNNDVFFSIAETLELLTWLKEQKVDFIFFNQREKDTRALMEMYNFNYEIKTKAFNVVSGNFREDVLVYVKQK